MRKLLACLGVLALAPAALGLGGIVVVDAQGGPGSDFTNLGAAVAFAPSGAVVLVRAGSYSGFTLSGKGLSIIAERGALVEVAGALVIEQVPVGSLALVRGITTSTPKRHGLHVANCMGQVFVEQCELRGQSTPSDHEVSAVYHGLFAENSAGVVVSRSTLVGGEGGQVGPFLEPFSGGSGALALESNLVVANCQLSGRNGATAPEDDWWNAGHGGSGVTVEGSRAWISGCAATCGDGGDGHYDYDLLTNTEKCGNGGDGGSGVLLEGTGHGSTFVGSTATVRDFDPLPGPGSGGTTECASPGANGQMIKVTSGSEAVVLPGKARGFDTNSPVRGGQNARLFAQGLPGDFFVVAIGFAGAFEELAGQPFPVAVDGVFKVLGVGVVPAGGVVERVVPIPLLDDDFGGVTLVLQPVLVPVGGSAAELAPPVSLTLLEQGS